jgi:hypothetical protein
MTVAARCDRELCHVERSSGPTRRDQQRSSEGQALLGKLDILFGNRSLA